MDAQPLRLLVVAADEADVQALSGAGWGRFDARHCMSLQDAADVLRQQRVDAIWLHAADQGAAQGLLEWGALSQAVLDAALVLSLPDLPPELALRLLRRGIQDVLPADAPAAEVARALCLGMERRRIERVARAAWATDVATGLPSHAQLIEHMSHLLALREREPAPMALLVLRVEGLASTETRLGSESGNVLRRKVAVRLRSGLRASDVVASIGADSFAVLLAWMDAPADALKVAEKLVTTLQRPFNLMGESAAVAVAVGASLYPQDGRDADSLLRRSISQAAAAPARGRAGFANFSERGGAGSAANDEEG